MNNTIYSKKVISLINTHILYNQSHNAYATLCSISDYLQENGIKQNLDISQLEAAGFRCSYIKPQKTIFFPTQEQQRKTHQLLLKEIRNVPTKFIFSLEEIGYQLHAQYPPCIVHIGEPTLLEIGRESKLSNMVAVISADGLIMKPLITQFKTKRNTLKNESFQITKPQNGVIDSFYTNVDFVNWFKESFIVNLKKRINSENYNGKIVIIADEFFKQCFSHVQNELTELNIQPFYLTNFTSKTLQPFNSLIQLTVQKFTFEKGNKVTPRRVIRNLTHASDYIRLTKQVIINAFFNVFNLFKAEIRDDSFQIIDSFQTKINSNHTSSEDVVQPHIINDIHDELKKKSMGHETIDTLHHFFKEMSDNKNLITYQSIQWFISNRKDIAFPDNIIEQMKDVHFQKVTPIEQQPHLIMETSQQFCEKINKIQPKPPSFVFCCDEFDFRIHNTFPFPSLTGNSFTTSNCSLTRDSKISTLFFCISANGEVLPPLCVLSNSMMIQQLQVLFPSPQIYFCENKNMFFTKQQLQNWFETVLVPYISDKEKENISFGGTTSILLPQQYQSYIINKYDYIDLVFIPNELVNYVSPLEHIFDSMVEKMVKENILITNHGILKENQQYHILNTFFDCAKEKFIVESFLNTLFSLNNGLLYPKLISKYIEEKYHYEQELSFDSCIGNTSVNNNDTFPFIIKNIPIIFKKPLKRILNSEECKQLHSKQQQILYVLSNFPLYSIYFINEQNNEKLGDHTNSVTLKKRPLSDSTSETLENTS
ncbi:DDE-1 domain-containing protein [Entamoeba marina]